MAGDTYVFWRAMSNGSFALLFLHQVNRAHLAGYVVLVLPTPGSYTFATGDSALCPLRPRSGFARYPTRKSAPVNFRFSENYYELDGILLGRFRLFRSSLFDVAK